MKHRCQRNRYVPGLGWKCADCDPRIVQQSPEQIAEVRARQDRLWRDEYAYTLRHARRRGLSLQDAQQLARESANCLFE